MFWRSVLFMTLCGLFAQHVALAQSAKISTADAARLYHDYCSVCHGDNGNGHSRAAAGLQPPPRDFTASQAAVELTRPRLVHSIREGRPGTAMTGWKTQLSDPQISALADYLRVRFMVPTAYDRSNEGRRVYAEYCSVCHGDRGNGQSRATPSLQPPPRDFTAEATRRDLTRRRMLFSTAYGRPNTAMAAWQTQLSNVQIEAVVDFIRANFMKIGGGQSSSVASQRAGADAARRPLPSATGAADFAASFPGALVGRREMGHALYLANCVPCHGIQGDGNGPRAFFILPRPRDFTHSAVRAGMNRPRLYEAIAKGVRGAEMPAWEKVLQPQQIADIGEYMLRAFIRPAHPAGPPAAQRRGKAGGPPQGTGHKP